MGHLEPPKFSYDEESLGPAKRGKLHGVPEEYSLPDIYMVPLNLTEEQLQFLAANRKLLLRLLQMTKYSDSTEGPTPDLYRAYFTDMPRQGRSVAYFTDMPRQGRSMGYSAAMPRQGRAMSSSFYFPRMGRSEKDGNSGTPCCADGVRSIYTAGKGLFEICPRDQECCSGLMERTKVYKDLVVNECATETTVSKVRDVVRFT